MVSVPLGTGAYKRAYAGEPEVRLDNRYVEKNVTNLREHISLLARPGSNGLVQCAGGTNRGNYSKPGLFKGDLFVVSGHNFWRVSAATGLATQITGTIANDGNPYVTWEKGIGYEFLFISDGSSLQYFTEHAVGTLTLTGNIQVGEIFHIGSVYYGWHSNVDNGTPNGTLANPWLALVDTTGADTAAQNANSLANMAELINFSGISGVTYSGALTGPSQTVTATSDATHLVVTAIDNTAAGNAITTGVDASGGGSIAWGGANLTGGGGTQLATIAMPNANEAPKALATVSSFVLVSVGNSQKFYWILPGATVINALNFAEKESNPDNILDMTLLGDQVLISGNGSTENWYATGALTAPFAPIQGRVYQRGIVEGTPVVVEDGVIIVGNDGRVYQIGYQFGANTQWGVHRISNPGIEERIRTQLRAEQGLPP